MYDTIGLRLGYSNAMSVDFLKETPRYFDITGEHYFNGETVITGLLNGFKVTVSKNCVSIKDGSLCKYYLGDNLQSLDRDKTKLAIESLSDVLHLSIHKAIVVRIDVAQNISVKYPVETYLTHLGELKYSKRSECTDSSLYYFQGKGSLIFYDKLKELKSKRQNIPESYQNKNILRYEMRIKKAISKTFNTHEVTASMLYREDFYISLIEKWKSNYKSIRKINESTLNFELMKGKKELYTVALLNLTQQLGGELAMINQINEAYRRKELTKKQAFDMRQAIADACKIREGITTQSDAIVELNRKIDEVCAS